MLYKLTDENGRTHGDTQWGPGVTHEGTASVMKEAMSGDYDNLLATMMKHFDVS